MIVTFNKKADLKDIKEDLELYSRGFDAEHVSYNNCHKCGGEMKMTFRPLNQKDMLAYKSLLECKICKATYPLE